MQSTNARVRTKRQRAEVPQRLFRIDSPRPWAQRRQSGKLEPANLGPGAAMNGPLRAGCELSGKARSGSISCGALQLSGLPVAG